MKISEEEVRYIAKLANLALSDDAVGQYRGDLEEILNYAEKLNELDTSGVEPMAQVIYADAEAETFREDVILPSFDAGTALRSAPQSGAGQFKVPKVIER